MTFVAGVFCERLLVEEDDTLSPHRIWCAQWTRWIQAGRNDVMRYRQWLSLEDAVWVAKNFGNELRGYLRLESDKNWVRNAPSSAGVDRHSGPQIRGEERCQCWAIIHVGRVRD